MPRGTRFARSHSRSGFRARRNSEEKKHMRKFSVVLLVSAAIVIMSGCATRKYVRNQVKTASDTLTAQIETTQGEIKEVRDDINKVNNKVSDVDTKVSGVDTKVSGLDTRTSEQ